MARFIRKDKNGDVNIGSGFFKLHFGILGAIILTCIVTLGVFLVYGILFGEGAV